MFISNFYINYPYSLIKNTLQHTSSHVFPKKLLSQTVSNISPVYIKCLHQNTIIPNLQQITVCHKFITSNCLSHQDTIIPSLPQVIVYHKFITSNCLLHQNTIIPKLPQVTVYHIQLFPIITSSPVYIKRLHQNTIIQQFTTSNIPKYNPSKSDIPTYNQGSQFSFTPFLLLFLASA